MTSLFSLCFISLLSSIYNQLIPCTIDDFATYVTKCDPSSNTRKITYYKNSQCEILNQTLLPLSNTPTFDIKCDTDCPSGSFLSLNLQNKQFECRKCPVNTYSTGKHLNLNIWNDEIIKMFDISCVSYHNDIIDDIKDCTEINISEDMKILTISSKDNEEINIAFDFDAVDSGEISFSYNKTEIIDENATNIDGLFTMYIDYDIIVNDSSHENNISNKLTTVSHSFEKGKHRLMLKYKSESHNNKHKLMLSPIIITNLFDISLECKECKTQSLFEGSPYCKGCKYNEVLNDDGKCEQCSEGKINIDNKCIAVPQCDEFDYHIIDVNEHCDSSKRTLFYITERNFPIYCYDNDISNEKQNNIKIDTDTKCIERIKEKEIKNCQSDLEHNKFIVNRFKLKNNFHQSEKFFDSNYNNKQTKTMLSNGNYIYVPKNANKGERYILSKRINIISYKGHIQFNVILDMKSSESIILKISNRVTPITKSDKYVIDLDKGDYHFELIYEKVNESNKLDNRIPLKLDSFEIIGGRISNRRDEFTCDNCPEGYSVDSSGYSCEKDAPIAVSPNATYDNDQMILKIKDKCPTFSIKSNTKVALEYKTIVYDIEYCELSHQFQINTTHLRINIASYYYYINSLSNIGNKYKSSNPLLGPIIYKAPQSSNEIYLSVFSPSLFAFDDFTLSLGYAFVIEHNYQYNSDSFITLARQLSETYLVDIGTNTGFLMRFNQGDSCESDMSIKRSIYVFLKCDKTIKGFSSPNVTAYSDNGCALFIEISSPMFCKTCIASEVKYTYGKCEYKQKQKIYEETTNCIFDHLDYLFEPLGNLIDTTNEDQLLKENSTAYLLMMKGKPKSKKKKNKKKKITLVDRYIENMSENVECDYIDYLENHFYIVSYIVVIIYFVSVMFMLIYCLKYCWANNKKDSNGMNKVKISSEH